MHAAALAYERYSVTVYSGGAINFACFPRRALELEWALLRCASQLIEPSSAFPAASPAFLEDGNAGESVEARQGNQINSFQVAVEALSRKQIKTI